LMKRSLVILGFDDLYPYKRIGEGTWSEENWRKTLSFLVTAIACSIYVQIKPIGIYGVQELCILI
jgi:hypothetical protein